MASTSLAVWRGPTPNQGPAMSEVRGLILHIAEGSFDGTIAWCKNPNSNVSTHFVTARDGRVAQMIDTRVAAWTQRAGNGHWVSVENEGFSPGPLSAEQVEACAQLLAWLHAEHDVPLQIATSPDGRGLGHHSMGTAREGWTGPTWGHEFCPGEAIKAQKPAILARAQQIAGVSPTPPEDDMALPPDFDNNWNTLIGRVDAVFADRPTNVVPSPYVNEENKLHSRLNLIDAQLAELKAAVAAIQPGDVTVAGPTAQEIAEAVVNEEHDRLAQ